MEPGDYLIIQLCTTVVFLPNVFGGKKVHCTIAVAVSGLKVAHQQEAGTSVAVLTPPFLDAGQLPMPLLRTQGSLALLFISPVQVPCGTAAL